MANVQPDKFTKIANELLEVIPLYKFNGTQFRIILVLWRYTYGFKRKEHDISVSFLVNATGITKRQIQKEVNNLIEKNVILEVGQPSFNKSRKMQFNKDYDSWKTEINAPKKQQANNKAEVTNSTPHQVTNSTPHQVNDLAPKKESIKEIYKEISTTKENEIDCFNFYERNIGMLSPHLVEQMGIWLEDFNEQHEIIILSIKIALERNKRSWGYIQAILKDWYGKGAKSLRDCEALQMERTATNKQSQNKKVDPMSRYQPTELDQKYFNKSQPAKIYDDGEDIPF